MKLRIVSSRNLLSITVFSAGLLAGITACDFPFNITIPGIGDIGIGTGEDDANANSSDDDMNANESDDDVNDNAGDDDGTDDSVSDDDDGHDDDGDVDDGDDGDDGDVDDGDDGDDGDVDDGDDDTDAGSLIGDADNGGVVFAANCAVCHGDDATGVVAPNIQGEDADDIFDHVISAHEGHTTFDVTDQEIADMEAFLATLVP